MPIIETIHKDNHNVCCVGLKSKALMGMPVVSFWYFCHKLFIDILVSLVTEGKEGSEREATKDLRVLLLS